MAAVVPRPAAGFDKLGGCVAVAVLFVAGLVASAAADTPASFGKEDVPLPGQGPVMRGKKQAVLRLSRLVGDQQWALRFYWLTRETDYDDAIAGSVPRGRRLRGGDQPLGRASTPRTVSSLRTRPPSATRARSSLEGSGLIARRPRRQPTHRLVPSLATATCFEQLDVADYPFGRGAGQRPAWCRSSRSRLESSRGPARRAALHPGVRRHGAARRLDPRRACVRADDTGGGHQGQEARLSSSSPTAIFSLCCSIRCSASPGSRRTSKRRACDYLGANR